jgi:hypothetical protein
MKDGRARARRHRNPRRATCLSLTVRNTIRHPRACGLAGYDVALTRRRSPVRIRSGPSILQRGRPKTPLPGGGRPLPVPPPRGDSRGKAVSAFLTPDSAQFFANVLRNALNHVDIRSQGTFGMCSTLQTGCRHTGLHLCHLPAQESLLLRQEGSQTPKPICDKTVKHCREHHEVKCKKPAPWKSKTYRYWNGHR